MGDLLDALLMSSEKIMLRSHLNDTFEWKCYTSCSNWSIQREFASFGLLYMYKHGW